MHLPPVIAMVAITKFSQKVDSRGSANDRFNSGKLVLVVVANNSSLLAENTETFHKLSILSTDIQFGA
jgi:hypothetical protein